jgi:hypothetical protein
MPTVIIDISQTKDMQLEEFAANTERLLEQAIEFCNTVGKQGQQKLVMPENFSFWKERDLISSPERIGNNVEIRDGEQTINPKENGFYTTLQEKVQKRAKWLDDAVKKFNETGDCPNGWTEDDLKKYHQEAQGLVVLLTFLKVRAKEMLPEVLACKTLEELTEDLIDCQSRQMNSGEVNQDVYKYDELMVLTNKLTGLIQRHNVLNGLVTEPEEGEGKIYTKRDVIESRKEFDDVYAKILEILDDIKFSPDDVENAIIKDKIYNQLDDVRNHYIIKNDINSMFPISQSEQGAGFQEFQKYATPISFGLGAAAIILGAASIGPQGVITLPMAMAAGYASLALSAPGLVKNIGTAAYDKAMYDVNPNKEQAMAIGGVLVMGGLMGGSMAVAAGGAIHAGISQTQTVLKDTKQLAQTPQQFTPECQQKKEVKQAADKDSPTRFVEFKARFMDFKKPPRSPEVEIAFEEENNSPS